jgi:DNA-binding response OmpR family regulator
MPAKKKIVLVEDEEGTALLLSEYLGTHGYETAWAKDGLQGLELVKKTLPDLVLLDLVTPGINGVDVLLEIKAHSKTKNIPVIVCSGNKLENLDKWMSWGAEDYISKPFDLKRVLQKVVFALSGKPARKPAAVA